MLNFNFDDLATSKAAKKVAQLFQRAGAPVIETTSDPKIRRTAGVSYREMNFTHADGQTTTLRVNKTGDVAQVLVNGALVPIKNQSDVNKAIGEIAGRLEAGRAKFQAKLARTKVDLPKGITTAAPKMEQKLTEEVARLDQLIEQRTAELADLKSKLGVVLDGVRKPKDEPLMVVVSDDGGVVLRMIPSDFQAAMKREGMPSKTFLEEAIKVYNEHKKKIGSTMRAEVVLVGGKKVLDGLGRKKEPEYELPFKLSGTLKNYAKKRKLELFEVVGENKVGDPVNRIEIWQANYDEEYGMIYNAEKDGLHLQYLSNEWKKLGVSEAPNWIKDEAGFKRLLDFLGKELAEELSKKYYDSVLDAARKNNQKGYAFYVVVNNKIESGWEYKEDAQEHVSDNLPSNMKGKVVAKVTLNKIGLNADDNSSWLSQSDLMDSASTAAAASGSLESDALLLDESDDEYFEDGRASLFDGCDKDDDQEDLDDEIEDDQDDGLGIFDGVGVYDSVEQNEQITEELAAIVGQEWPLVPAGEINKVLAGHGFTVIDDNGNPWLGEMPSEDGQDVLNLQKDGVEISEQLTVQWQKMPSGKYQIAAYLS